MLAKIRVKLQRLLGLLPAGFFIVVLAALLSVCGCAGQAAAAAEPAPVRDLAAVTAEVPPDLAPGAVLPVDPEVRLGRLDNGLTYYVRANRKPENRAELRLVVNAGSILEDEDQLGLAHFVEHMAFNGTEHFEKQEIVDYLESIGMPFGPEVNAYTTYDETVYLLQVPTEDPEVMETAVQILEDWAHLISFDPEEVNKERPVIVEEWRLGRGAEARLRDRQHPVLFKDSRYAERRPIGEMRIVENAGLLSLRRFYRDWYRPDLMAVIAVGDFDAGWMEELLRRSFGRLQAPESPRERSVYPVPAQTKTLYAPATDPEATSTRVSLYVKSEPQVLETVADYRRELVQFMYNGMLNERLQELARKADASFVTAGSLTRRLIRPLEAYILAARVREARIVESLEVLLTETERVRRYGFTASELARVKESVLTWIERIYRERDNLESEELAGGFTSHFLEQEPIPSVEYEYRLIREYLPRITLEEVNALAQEILGQDNRVVLVSAPESEAAAVPERAEVLALFDEVASRELSPYEDTVLEGPLFTAALDRAELDSETEIAELGLHELKLSNGVRVVLKPTDFKKEQILFAAFSPGGHSRVSEEQYVAAVTACPIVTESGVDGFDSIQLQKMLAGKTVSVDPWIGELYEGMRGSARPEDLETLFQLIYLYFTEPRRDLEGYQAYKQRLQTMVANRASSPEAVFWDTVQTAVSGGHFRRRPWTPAVLEEMDLDVSLAVYRERFADAGDFTFVFTGTFTLQQIRPLAVAYLGSLPASGRLESWRDLGIDPPRGIVEREVRKGIENRSRVEIVFSGGTEWSLERRLELEALKQVLGIALRENVREEAGGSYDIGVAAELNRYPDEEYFVYVGFGCAPEQVESLTALVFEQVADLRRRGPPGEDVAKVREILRREHEQNLRENEYWLGVLQLAYLNDLDPRVLLDFDRRLQNVTTDRLRSLAVETLRPDSYLRVVLYPEDYSG